jgi:hypothetical protein
MKGLRIALLVLGLGLSGASAADDNLWLGAKAGTLGLGVEGTWRPLPWFDIRGGINSFEYEDGGAEAGIDYDATLDLQTWYGTANFRMPLSPFRVTAGVFNNGNELRLVSRETGAVDVGGTVFTSDEAGTMRAVTTFEDIAPYAGIGFDFGLFGKVGLNLDLGVMYQGEPEIGLFSDGLLAEDPAFQEALENERVQLQDEVDRYKLYPVASLTFNVQFL